jgi:polysaccharide chain length determinant protein (PEP-CTERM system associated)
MSPQIFDYRRFLLKMRTAKHWWIPLALVVAVAVNVVGLLRPERYRATALVLIRQPPIPDQRVRDTFRLNDMLQTIRQRIQSFSFLSEIARKLNLDAGIPPNSAEYENLIEGMRRSVSLNTRTDYFELTYSGFEPNETYNVTDAILKQFIYQSGQYYNEKAQKGVQFLETQLRLAEVEMKHAQDEIRGYKDAHIKEIPEAQAEHMGRLAKRRDEFQMNVAALEASRDGLVRAKQEIFDTPRELTTEVTQSDSPELRQLRAAERQLRMKLEMLIQVNGYTPDHWAVTGVQKELNLIADQITSAGAQIATETTSQPNSHFLNLQKTITDYELKIGELQKHLQQQTAEIATLETYLEAIPKRQDELKTLERNYRTAEDQVEYYRSQHNQALKASIIEAQGMGPSFEIKDPPRVPATPYSPNRAKIAAVGFVLGGGAAFGLLFLLCLFDQSVRSVEEARSVLQMPVLGIVQRIVTPSQIALQRAIRRRRLFGVSATVVLLLVVGVIGYLQFREELLLGVGNLRDLLKQR